MLDNFKKFSVFNHGELLQDEEDRSPKQETGYSSADILENVQLKSSRVWRVRSHSGY